MLQYQWVLVVVLARIYCHLNIVTHWSVLPRFQWILAKANAHAIHRRILDVRWVAENHLKCPL